MVESVPLELLDTPPRMEESCPVAVLALPPLTLAAPATSQEKFQRAGAGLLYLAVLIVLYFILKG